MSDIRQLEEKAGEIDLHLPLFHDEQDASDGRKN